MITNCFIPQKGTFTKSVNNQFNNLKKINLIFGPNGSGKTTISRCFKERSITASYDVAEDPNFFVYNIDYINENFLSNNELPGIFTLGQNNIALENKIKKLEAEIEDAQRKIEDDIKLLGPTEESSELSTGLFSELSKLNDTFENRIWVKKKELDDLSLKNYIGPYRGSKKSFSNYLISQYEKIKGSKSEKLKEIRDLENEAKQLELNNKNPIEFLNTIEIPLLEKLIKSDIFQTKIIGRSDIDIAALIDSLNNSDWIKQGLIYLEKSKNVCPFCQQRISSDLTCKINEYFDNSYDEQIKVLKNAETQFKSIFSDIEHLFAHLSSLSREFVESSEILELYSQIQLEFKDNLSSISEKIKNPSQIVKLTFSENLYTSFNLQIEKVNEKIEKYNDLIANVNDNKTRIQKELWCTLVNDSKEEIEDFLKDKSSKEDEISKLQLNIETNKTHKHKIETELIQLKKQTTSCIPTMESINHQLILLGFTGFKLELAKNNISYQLVRNNTEKASISSLSEGERNFLSFLYFCNSFSDIPKKQNNILVIDDPVSSLDSDVAYLVSTMIKRIFVQLVENKSNFSQVFVSSHNLFFFKEISEMQGIKSVKKNSSFFVLKKDDNITSIIYYEENPIKSSYEMLWLEYFSYLKDKDNGGKVPCLNVMRRILEYYFQFIGNKKINKLCDDFTGEERIAVRALINNLHAESHSSMEDLFFTPNFNFNVISKVFKEIFEKTNNSGHYDSMISFCFENKKCTRY